MAQLERGAESATWALRGVAGRVEGALSGPCGALESLGGLSTLHGSVAAAKGTGEHARRLQASGVGKHEAVLARACSGRDGPDAALQRLTAALAGARDVYALSAEADDGVFGLEPEAAASLSDEMLASLDNLRAWWAF